PEEDDVEAGHEGVRRIVPLELRRLVGPAEGGERPQSRREPGVENVRIANEIDPRAVVSLRGCERQVLRLLDKDLPIRAVPGRNLMPPPQLARDAPRLDVPHPLEVGLLPVLGNELRAAIL